MKIFIDFIADILGRVPFSCWVILIGAGIVSFVWIYTQIQDETMKKSEAVSRGLLPIYIIILFVLTIFIRREHPYIYYMLEPFWSYREILRGGRGDLLVGNIGNIVMFIPWGVIPVISSIKINEHKLNGLWIIGSGFLCSLMIELVQLVCRRGIFEFDDIFNNTVGVLIGYFICIMVRKRSDIHKMK